MEAAAAQAFRTRRSAPPPLCPSHPIAPWTWTIGSGKLDFRSEGWHHAFSKRRCCQNSPNLPKRSFSFISKPKLCSQKLMPEVAQTECRPNEVSNVWSRGLLPRDSLRLLPESLQLRLRRTPLARREDISLSRE